MLTRSNVAYNLHISPHREVIPYGDTNVEYVFSSDLYRRKFLEKREANRKDIELSLYNRFGVILDCSILADLRLYKHTEKRGYLLFCDGKEVVCQSNLRLECGRMILQSSER